MFTEGTMSEMQGILYCELNHRYHDNAYKIAATSLRLPISPLPRTLGSCIPALLYI